MAQLYVNSDLVKPKAINVYDGVNQQWMSEKIGYVRANGEWIPFIKYKTYLYERGVEYVTVYNRVSTKYTTYIAMNSTNPSGFYTDFMDFTNIKKIGVTISKSMGNSYVRLGLKDSTQEVGSNAFVVYTEVSSDKNTGERNIELDVSSVTGEYRLSFYSAYTSVYVHAIYIE